MKRFSNRTKLLLLQYIFKQTSNILCVWMSAKLLYCDRIAHGTWWVEGSSYTYNMLFSSVTTTRTESSGQGRNDRFLLYIRWWGCYYCYSAGPNTGLPNSTFLSLFVFSKTVENENFKNGIILILKSIPKLKSDLLKQSIFV